ncbi:Elongation of fatty acids protein 2 [Apophysomyces ossiformis]|uniref:Flap endonuclease 1 n=1 Tax=Apophysomyces ossiformis TaxID=679940 RepID=A0A8H7BS68_9FUNG|nr:Elongation of fatty acids protein 2 [Apophysomyces ossiformis]
MGLGKGEPDFTARPTEKVVTQRNASGSRAVIPLRYTTLDLFRNPSVRMGIQGLTRLISEHAPQAIKSHDISSYFGRKVAIDASMSIYQFMIAVRQQDGQVLTNEAGETTSHLMGMFYRTVRMVDSGIKPVYVFDGKPPTLKSGELAKRKARKEEAQGKMEEASEVGTAEEITRFTKRTVRVTQQHNDECKRLLKCMGIPYVEAPCEAEAQCAELARAGKVYAAASEDMDTLTFASPILLRHLTFSEQRKMPIDEVHLDKALEGLEMDMNQFVDLCILCGCDYVQSIRGIGPARAYSMIKEHKSIEKALPHLPEKLRANVPEDWKFDDARELFLKPEVLPGESIELKWELPDVEGVVDFLVKEKGFNEDRIRKSCEKLVKNVKSATQSRMLDFFKAQPSTAKPKKRPAAESPKKDTKKSKATKKK